MGENTQLVVLTSQLQETFKIGRKSKKTRRILRSTLHDLKPLVKEIEQYNEHLDPPKEEIKILIREKNAGEEGVDLLCKNLCWEKPLSLLERLWHNVDESYVAANDKQALVAKDVKETLYKMREILELLNRENFELKFNESGAPLKRPFGIPENPEFTVGLDVPLTKLKMEVLKDGGSTLLLTGLGGSGKTTLATKLCRDEQVKGKFRENILFFTFSETPKLKVIVERLFEHCGFKVPEFQSDEEAVNRLELFLRKIEGSPMLLVLDDVWPGSEALVEKLQFQISDYKVLVTSRVAFPRFGTPCILNPLVHEDSITLFRHYALLEDNSSNSPDEDIVQKVVRNCKGLPLAIKVIARSLSNRPYKLWQKIAEELSEGHSILDSNAELLSSLQKIFDVLEDNPVTKECFMDLGLFPEDQRIPVNALIDMWAELCGLDDDGREAMAIINKLDSMNLANVLIARKNASDADNYYYNNHFIVLHDLLRELAIHQSSQGPIEQRKRLIIEINENKRERWLAEKQKGMIARILSKFHGCGVKQMPQQVPARIVSLSTDETCTSYLSDMQAAQAEVLILNLQTKQYTFPEFMEKMSELKVLILTNYGYHTSQLNNFEQLGSLSNLKRIRLERIFVPSFATLKNLKKLSLYMCNTRQAFENGMILISDAFPNLVDLNIDYCKDMVGLPTGLCDITPLKKLSITNCHKLSALPKDIGKLEDLELLRLSSCTDLVGIPDSIGSLSNLRLLDISNCISLSSLPEDIGNLCNLRNIYMTSCARCELPFSVANLKNLKVVICDEETATSWESFEPMLPNLKIEIPQVDVNLNWLH
ncbi:probable disease resistance protein At5g66900 [Gastrolobium bilobum]|uniref:probable disease resistance protein At5g66900 n=1 Tax=Gastrolobium bilobum TaxID=150636 RepID=UPI002AB03790|nr:probable disease resistance protein At5g66900 [Gastrolobium bilobum]